MARRMRISAEAKLGILLFIAFFDNFTQIPMVAPYATSLGATVVMAGWIVAIYSVTNMLGNVAAGLVLDTMGRRTPLAVGLFWAGLGVWLYGKVGTPIGLLGARAFHGLGGSIVVPAVFTLAADILPSSDRGRGMGRIGAMIGLAAIFGPMFSGIVRQVWHVDYVFAVVFLFMIVGSILALTLPETLQRNEKQTTSETETASSFATLSFTLTNISGFAISFYLGALTLLLPLQMEAAGLNASRSGTVFSLFAVVAVIIMLMRRRVEQRVVLTIGFISIAFAFLFLTISSSLAAICVGMGLFGAGFGLVYPSLNMQIANTYRVQARGRAYGIFYAFYSLGVVIAPPLLGWLTTTVVTVQTAYALLAAFAAILALFLYVYRYAIASEAHDSIQIRT